MSPLSFRRVSLENISRVSLVSRRIAHRVTLSIQKEILEESTDAAESNYQRVPPAAFPSVSRSFSVVDDIKGGEAYDSVEYSRAFYALFQGAIYLHQVSMERKEKEGRKEVRLKRGRINLF